MFCYLIEGSDMGPTHKIQYKSVLHRIDSSKRDILSEDIKSELHLNNIAKTLVKWEEQYYLFHLKKVPDVYDIQNETKTLFQQR